MLVADANRRVEMHLNEIRMLKEDNKALKTHNKELRDLCVSLDDDRQKIKRLSKEWQKFGRYTSELMKQEINAYQSRMQEYEQKQQQLLSENEELKRLCLYLDEQRQAILTQVAERQNMFLDENSSDAGCGSSARSSDSEQCNGHCNENLSKDQEKRNSGMDYKFNHEQEKALRMITQQMQTSLTIDSNLDTTVTTSSQQTHHDRLFNYIQSLENRIKLLEQSQSNMQLHDGHFSRSHSRVTGSDREDSPSYFNSNTSFRDGMQEWSASPGPVDSMMVDPLKPIQILSHLNVDDHQPKTSLKLGNKMIESTTSTMTSSGTTYCSSETDESAATAVFVMSDDLDPSVGHLEVRTLGPIDEEDAETETIVQSPENKEKPIEINEKSSVPPEKPARRRDRNRYMSEPLMEFERKSSEEPIWVTEREIHLTVPDSGVESQESKRNSDLSGSSAEHADNEGDSSVDVPELPPRMRLIGESGRLSLCSSNLSLDNFSNSSRHSNSSIKTVETNRSLPDELPNFRTKGAPPPYNHNHLRIKPGLPTIAGVNLRANLPRRHTSSLAEAVKILRVHEKAAEENMRELNEHETAIVHQMCQVAWNSLDRKTQTPKKEENLKDLGFSAHITAV
uniref:Potential DNA-binding domain-containing protein n=1 Tax=Acrobeloides nanus TaxID=290746 RepID=A0A914BZ60_9BILA